MAIKVKLNSAKKSANMKNLISNVVAFGIAGFILGSVFSWIFWVSFDYPYTWGQSKFFGLVGMIFGIAVTLKEAGAVQSEPINNETSSESSETAKPGNGD